LRNLSCTQGVLTKIDQLFETSFFSNLNRRETWFAQPRNHGGGSRHWAEELLPHGDDGGAVQALAGTSPANVFFVQGGVELAFATGVKQAAVEGFEFLSVCPFATDTAVGHVLSGVGRHVWRGVMRKQCRMYL